MTTRPQRRLEQLTQRSFFRVRTKARAGEAYPTGGSSAGWFLPVVYNAQQWTPTSLTETQSVRTELAYSETWLAEGIDAIACRYGERLFLLPIIELYSVRSYNPGGSSGEGQTQWKADYWLGSSGTFTASNLGTGRPFPNGDVLRVTVDAAGDVYVAGPRATAIDGTSHWNVVKYAGETGEEVWKRDVDFGLAATGVPGSRTNNVWSITYGSVDDTIYLLSDYDSSFAASPRTAALRPDGSAGSTASLTGNPRNTATPNALTADRGLPYLLPIFPVNASLGGSNYQAISDDRLLTVYRFADATTYGANAAARLDTWDASATVPFYYGHAPLSGVAVKEFWLQYDGSTYPDYSPMAADMIVGGSGQLAAVSAQRLFLSSTSDHTQFALLDTGVDASFPVTCRWRDDARQPTLLRFQDDTYLIVVSPTDPTTLLARTSDGSKVWGHKHLQVTGVAVDATAIITVGVRKSPMTDEDFI